MFRVPFAESMAETPQLRQTQAINNLCTWAKAERDALKLLTENACASTPVLLGYKEEVQGPNDLVPGGYMLYLAMTKLPGCRLGVDYHFESNELEVAQIRQAFETAWINCCNAGVVVCPGTLDNLMWDTASKKIYIIGFQESRPSRPGEVWDDSIWKKWGFDRKPTFKKAFPSVKINT